MDTKTVRYHPRVHAAVWLAVCSVVCTTFFPSYPKFRDMSRIELFYEIYETAKFRNYRDLVIFVNFAVLVEPLSSQATGSKNEGYSCCICYHIAS